MQNNKLFENEDRLLQELITSEPTQEKEENAREI